MMLDYYEIDIIPLHDDKFQNALQMVMNWYQIWTTHNAKICHA
jgi:hypothetical protein